MNIHKKIGGVPVWGWGLAVVGGLVLGIYLRRRAKSSSSSSVDTSGLLTAAQGGGIADPNAGLDSSGILAGLFEQQSELLSALLASINSGGGGVPAAGTSGDTSGSTVTPTFNVGSSGAAGASPAATTAPAPTDSTFATPSTTTYDVAHLGQPIGSVTGPTIPFGAPASELYSSVGLSASDPVTLLPADSAYGTSTGPNAQLSTQAQKIPTPGTTVLA